MLEQLLDAVLDLHGRPGESEAAVLQRLRAADARLTPLYQQDDVDASSGYADPLVRAAYLLRYVPHYTLQLGDLLRSLEGSPEVAQLICRPQLRHASFCGGPAPEAIALAVLHGQAGGQQLQTTVLDGQASDWRDCWPISAEVAMAFSGHPAVHIDGLSIDLAVICSPQERDLLGGCQLLTLMNALNELMSMGTKRLRQRLELRLSCLPPGALVLMSDQASYQPCRQGMELLRQLLEGLGARILIARTSREQALTMENRFELSPRLRNLYDRSVGPGGPFTRRYRIWNHQLQLAALLPG